MPPFTLDGVRRHAAELDARPVSTPAGHREQVEVKVRHHADLLSEARQLLADWNEQVFRAYQPPDAAIDDFLREWLTTRLTPAKSAAKLGRGWQRSYFVPQGHRVPELDRLHELLAEVTYLLDNWLPAARSISPAPRTRIPEAVAEKMRAKLLALTAAAAQPATVTPAPSRVTDPELV